MNDLVWLANHPHQSNVTGIPTSQNPDTPEVLDSRLSIRIHRIPAELPHSTELELGKIIQPEWIPLDLLRSSYFEDSQQAGKSSGPQNLASLSTLQRMNLEAL
jgi:hypothetical protein